MSVLTNFIITFNRKNMVSWGALRLTPVKFAIVWDPTAGLTGEVHAQGVSNPTLLTSVIITVTTAARNMNQISGQFILKVMFSLTRVA